MITIHGIPPSVHARKTIVTAILKKIDYRFEVAIPVVADQPPANRIEPSRTGLIPAMQDSDFRFAHSTATCLYLEKKRPAPAVLPADARALGRAMWFDAYAGGTIFRHLVHPLFDQTIVAPKVQKVPSDTVLIDRVLTEVQPQVLDYLESEIEGRFLVGDAMTLADIAIASNFIVYYYIGYKIDVARYPKLVRYLQGIVDNQAFRKALDDERPFVANMGLDRSFLD